MVDVVLGVEGRFFRRRRRDALPLPPPPPPPLLPKGLPAGLTGGGSLAWLDIG